LSRRLVSPKFDEGGSSVKADACAPFAIIPEDFRVPAAQSPIRVNSRHSRLLSVSSNFSFLILNFAFSAAPRKTYRKFLFTTPCPPTKSNPKIQEF
jgi:hypothetical protein